MRILLAVIILAALGWGGYWFIGSRTVEGTVQTWLEQRAAEGWVVSTSGVNTIGFPNRFDTTISDLELADPATGIAWKAPFFQIFALSYRPNHIIAIWPDRQTIATPYQTITATSGNMRGSVVFESGADLHLDRATIEFDTIGLVSTQGWNAALAHGQLSVRQAPVKEFTYDIAFDAQDLIVPDAMSQSLKDRGLASDQVETLKLDATVQFDAPWDRYSIEQRRPQPRRVTLDLAQAVWGKLDLRIAGDLTVDETGAPTGEITIKAKNWKEMLQLGRSSGLIPESIYPVVESGMKTLASLSGNKSTLDVPLTLRNGHITLGGIIPLGSAPRLILR